jgi:hypothetical protein
MIWYDKEEEYLQRMQEICGILSQKYMNLYIMMHRKQTKLRLPAIILSSCSGVASFGSSSFNASTMRKISIAVGVVNVGIAVLQTYESYLKVADIVAKSLSASQALKKLVDDIQCELFIPIEDRSCNGITFLRDCFGRYQAILDQAPPIEELTNAKLLRMRLNHEIQLQNQQQRSSAFGGQPLLSTISENGRRRTTDTVLDVNDLESTYMTQQLPSHLEQKRNDTPL